jgi:hypothetical protein
MDLAGLVMLSGALHGSWTVQSWSKQRARLLAPNELCRRKAGLEAGDPEGREEGRDSEII